MSSSLSSPMIHVVADSGTPTAAVILLDSNSKLVKRGAGRIETDVPPGLYKVRYSTSDGAAIEEIFEASLTDENPKILDQPNLPRPRPAAVEDQPQLFDLIRATAVQLSKQPGAPKGTGSGCFVFAMGLPPDPGENSSSPHPAAGLKVLTFDGALIADLATATPQNGCVGATIDLDPGSYLLRLELPGDEVVERAVVEQTIVTCSGWQTQVLLPLQARPRLASAGNPIRALNLEEATVFMSPLGQGLNAEGDINSWVEMARGWLARGEPVAPIAELQRAVKDVNDQRKFAVNDEAFRDILRMKFTNPMLGIYAAHLLTLTPELDQDLEELLKEVSDNLKILLGSHPDVLAIDLWLDPKAKPQPFLSPPMLRNSWKILVNRSRRFEDLVPTGSYCLRIAERLWGSGAWLIWLSPPTEVETQPSGKVDLNLLSAYIRKQLDEKQTSQLIDEVTAKNLTGMESALFAYVAEVVRGQTATEALGDQIERIEWLGPLNSLYRKISPFTLEKKAAKTAHGFLLKDSVVQKLGIPQAAVTEAAAGLIQKFGLK